jgi:hypothetical protein
MIFRVRTIQCHIFWLSVFIINNNMAEAGICETEATLALMCVATSAVVVKMV